MLRTLLNILIALSVLIFLAVVVIWVRSSWRRDMAYYQCDDGYFLVQSYRNRLVAQWVEGKRYRMNTPLRGIHSVVPPIKPRLPPPKYQLNTGDWDIHSFRSADHDDNIGPNATVDRRVLGFWYFSYPSYPNGAFPFFPQYPTAGIGVPYWQMFMLTAVFPVIGVRRVLRWRRKRVRLRSGECVACGYDLRGSRGECPECGAIFQQVDAQRKSPHHYS